MDSQVVSGSSSSRIGGATSSQTLLGHGQPSASSSSIGSSAPAHSRRISSGSSFQPIGRPRGTGGANSSFSAAGGGGGNEGFSFSSAANELGIGEDDGLFVGSSSASLRSISPPLAVLGSGALLDDMMEEEESSAPSAAGAGSRSASSSLFGNGVFAPPIGTGAIGTSRTAAPAPDDIWGSTPASAVAHDSPAKRAGVMPPPGIGGPSWGGPGSQYVQPAAPVVAADRPSVIRDRARISFTQLDAATQSSSSAPNASSVYPIGDVYRVFLALYPDSTSVDVREFLESCLVPGSVTNGNGTFNFQQRGNVLLMGYETGAAKLNGEIEAR